MLYKSDHHEVELNYANIYSHCRHKCLLNQNAIMFQIVRFNSIWVAFQVINFNYRVMDEACSFINATNDGAVKKLFLLTAFDG
ncbi:CLUMA_CG005281, isoform A [Clunio marinus]|uniref:CLUMA_CG005281, isoform A n=1 Tax=Clunio marinus TaxID=568069 RepID=A0A1J1HUE5_9DIPT|nr:CLUMA_CG005281, isoform A [Clunio marinus]